MSVEVVDLEKAYSIGVRKIVALDCVSLSIERSDFVVITGPSGSGKTTLLNIIGCIDRPDSGTVLVDGVDITRASNEELVKLRLTKVGHIFQSFNLLPALTALENVELPMVLAKKPRVDRRKRALKLLRAVGLGDRADHRPSELSLGEQQRVAIARALANDPPIVLADEPASNLDPGTAREIMSLLKKLNEELGKTLVVATHDPLIASTAKRVVWLVGGRIVGDRRLR